MSLSGWAKDQIEARSQHHRLVCVHDPYELLDPCDLPALRDSLRSKGRDLLTVRNALQLREGLEDREPASAKLVVPDQSYTLRDPHLLPKDAQPTDLVSLRAPDWKPLVSQEAFFTPTVREFLCHLTGDQHWPVEVSIYPYEKLARDDPHRFVQAFDTFRRTGRALCTGDLVVVGASAYFGVDLFDISQPLPALELAFHRPESWLNLEDLFNSSEIDLIRQRLQSIPQPIGDLFGQSAENARMALVALLILRQHFEEPGRHLPILSPSLAGYQDCSIGLCLEAPSWFLDHEVPRFEKLLTKAFRDHLHGTLELGDEQKARGFVQRERFSDALRGLAPFAIPRSTRRTRRTETRDEFSFGAIGSGVPGDKTPFGRIGGFHQEVRCTPALDPAPRFVAWEDHGRVRCRGFLSGRSSGWASEQLDARCRGPREAVLGNREGVRGSLGPRGTGVSRHDQRGRHSAE